MAVFSKPWLISTKNFIILAMKSEMEHSVVAVEMDEKSNEIAEVMSVVTELIDVLDKIIEEVVVVRSVIEVLALPPDSVTVDFSPVMVTVMMVKEMVERLMDVSISLAARVCLRTTMSDAKEA